MIDLIDPATARHARVTTRCPHCAAAPGNPCVVPSTGRPLRHTRCHPARIDAATRIDACPPRPVTCEPQATPNHQEQP